MMSWTEDQGDARPLINLQEEPRNRYEILRVVNRGGMGEIALGRVRGAKGFEKLVVLKRLRADAERDDHIAMFDVEQELMSRIEHPNIVKVFDQPIIDNTPYLAMEYVRGRNLDQIIRQAKDASDKLNLQFSLTVISEVLRGLAFVHRLKDNEGKALGVVHQDITPSNIMVSFFGEVKITDFGISYVTSRDGGLRRGVLKGKPRYVAPEVLAGKRVNNRADIYGVGLVLFEMITQNALFARASVKETLAAVARGEVPDFKAEIPNLEDGSLRIFQRSLAKDPADRYRTAEEMGADVIAELARLGGVISPARLGYIVRQHFSDDPDVPEIDPSFEAALAAEAQPVLPSTFRPPDLSQTISELDRLLGPRQSTDLFTLPPDLKSELAGIEDMDPFLALTPIPDFVWDAPNDAELLRRAGEEFGPADAVVREPPPLGGPDELDMLDPLSAKAQDGLQPFPSMSGLSMSPQPRNDSIPSFDGLRSKNTDRKFDPMPKVETPLPQLPAMPSAADYANATTGPTRVPSGPKLRAPSTPNGMSASPMPTSVSGANANQSQSPVPSAALRAPSTPGMRIDAPERARPRTNPGFPVEKTPTPVSSLRAEAPRVEPSARAPSVPKTNTSGSGIMRPPVESAMPRTQAEVNAPDRAALARAPSAEPEIAIARPEELAPRVVQSVTTTDAEVPDRRNFQFWLGLGLGLALGVMLGAAMYALFSV